MTTSIEDVAATEDTARAKWWEQAGPLAVNVTSPTETAARQVLIDACAETGILDSATGQVVSDEKLLRRARRNTTPDVRGGDRTEWDRVENAARILGLARSSRTVAPFIL